MFKGFVKIVWPHINIDKNNICRSHKNIPSGWLLYSQQRPRKSHNWVQVIMNQSFLKDFQFSKSNNFKNFRFLTTLSTIFWEEVVQITLEIFYTVIFAVIKTWRWAIHQNYSLNSGKVSNWWNGGGDDRVHSNVSAPSPHGLASAFLPKNNA